MKKIVLVFWMAIIAIFMTLQFPSNIHAASSDGSYGITKYTVNVDIDEKGDAEMTQYVTYDFVGDFHGVYYNQATNGIKGVGDPEVMVKDGGNTVPISKSSTGENNTFSVNNTSDYMKLKVYHAVSDKTVTFIYKYKLYGVITNYKDTAELNWKIIGGGWDHDLNIVKITINLPAKNIKGLKAWAHGRLDGYNDVDKKAGKVVLTANQVPSEGNVESHIIFPTSVTPLNSNKVNKNAKNKILAQEKQLAKQANAARERPKKIGKITIVVLIFIFILIYLINYLILKKNPANKHPMPTPLFHWFDSPTILPSMANVVLNKANEGDSKGFMGDLMIQVNEHNVELKKEEKTFRIIALKEPEDDLLKFMVNTIGDGTSVTLKDIDKYAKKDKKGKLNDQYVSWKKRAASGSNKYLDIHNKNIINRFIAAAIISTVLLVISIGISALLVSAILLPLSIFAILAIIFCWSVSLTIKHKVSSYTEEGEQLANELRAFKRMFEDVDDLNLAEVGDLILWEQILPYAVAFGISPKVIKALKTNFGSEVIESNPAFIYYWYGYGYGSQFNIEKSLSSSFSTSNTASSSISGSSGGFSGGSSGGFGGGSGGGAF